MVRAATYAESHPPIVVASPELAALIRGYLKARAEEQTACATHGLWSEKHLTAANVEREAKGRVEAAIRGVPDAWHVVGEIGWRIMKLSARGLELTCKPEAEIRILRGPRS
jgi:hypothetical protein